MATMFFEAQGQRQRPPRVDFKGNINRKVRYVLDGGLPHLIGGELGRPAFLPDRAKIPRLKAAAAEYIRRQRQLGAKERLAALELLNCLNPDTLACCPSCETIAKRVGCSRHTVLRAIKALKDLGLLRWHRTRRGPNIYVWNFSRFDAGIAMPIGAFFNDGPYRRGARASVARAVSKAQAWAVATADTDNVRPPPVDLDGPPPVLPLLSAAALRVGGR